MTKIKAYKIPAAVNFPFIIEGTEEKKVKEPYNTFIDFSSISDVIVRNYMIDFFNKSVSVSNSEMLNFIINANVADANRKPTKVMVKFLVENIPGNINEYEKINESLEYEDQELFTNGATYSSKAIGYTAYLGLTKANFIYSNQIKFGDVISDEDNIPQKFKNVYRSFTKEEAVEEHDKIVKLNPGMEDSEIYNKWKESCNKGKPEPVDIDDPGLFYKCDGLFFITIDKTILDLYKRKSRKFAETYTIVICHELAHVYADLLSPRDEVLSDKLEEILRMRLADIKDAKSSKEINNQIKKYTEALGNGPGHSKYNYQDKIVKDEVGKLLTYLKENSVK
jgi:hypothetical protein